MAWTPLGQFWSAALSTAGAFNSLDLLASSHGKELDRTDQVKDLSVILDK